jgi:hypothetical protein
MAVGERMAAGRRLATMVVLAAVGLGLTAGSAQAAIVFGKSTLQGTSSDKPTSLQFGPDGRLYVAQQNGVIKAYTVARNGANQYAVTATETIPIVNTIPNHDDDGSANPGITTRLVTGILVTGSAQQPEIYVTSSDPRIGGSTHGDLGLDTNSGALSKLTKSGGSWTKQDLVRGLPRSEENHTSNGMAKVGSTLYIAQGGNTNAGAPSQLFAQLPEYALSAAILSVSLNAIPEGGYSLPTLGGTASPFGGDDGLNQALLESTGPVKVYAPGFRNPYDLVQTAAGRLYSIDNGGNAGWGTVPENEGPAGNCTNAMPAATGSTERDSLHLITGPGYYGGHPNPTRGNTSNTFGGASPVKVAANPVECDFRSSGDASGNGRDDGSLASFGKSTNGLTEYTASNFGGELKGDLIAAGFDNILHRIDLNAAGTSNDNSTLISNASGGGMPLDVTALGDAGKFPGTVWFADIADDGVYALEPGDYGGAVISCDLNIADSDNDGYTNDDEQLNGTNPCSPGDTPPDFEGDRVSDRLDGDDDNDGRPDLSDPFARDRLNGLGTSLPVNYVWENDAPSPGGLLNLGFTGLMTNGATDYLDQFDPLNMTTGGAAGVVTIDEVDAGDATGNQQKYGFQFGINARPERGAFTAHTRIMAPFAGMSGAQGPGDFQSMGMFVGTGNQDDYVKVVTGHAGGTAVLAATDAGVRGRSPLAMPGPDYVDLYLRVDPVTGTVQPSFTSITAGATTARTNVGNAVVVPKAWFTDPTGLAVGILSSSGGPAPPFSATWDFIEVVPTPGGQGASDDRVRPVLAQLWLSPWRFRAASRSASVAVSTGTTVRFRLSEAATVRLLAERARSGRRRGRKCVAPRRARPTAKRCTRFVAVKGRATASGKAGSNRLRFRGRLAGRRLAPGRYRLVVTAIDQAGNRSRAKRAGFTVVR